MLHGKVGFFVAIHESHTFSTDLSVLEAIMCNHGRSPTLMVFLDRPIKTCHVVAFGAQLQGTEAHES